MSMLALQRSQKNIQTEEVIEIYYKVQKKQ